MLLLSMALAAKKGKNYRPESSFQKSSVSAWDETQYRAFSHCGSFWDPSLAPRPLFVKDRWYKDSPQKQHECSNTTQDRKPQQERRAWRVIGPFLGAGEGTLCIETTTTSPHNIK